MYDWVDDFRQKAIWSFPGLRNYIDQCCDLGDTEQMLELLLNLVCKDENLTH